MPSDWDSRFEAFINFYRTVQKLVISAERLDPDDRLNISAIVEFRAAFTHLMRVHAAQFGLVDAEHVRKTGFTLADYCEINLNKALAHLYRAGYDAYDAIAIALDLKIREITEGFSRSTIYAVMPDAATRIYQVHLAALTAIDGVKTDKDVENADAEHIRFQEFEAAIGRLQDVYELLEGHMAEFQKYEQAQKDSDKKAFAIGSGMTVVGALLGWAVSKLLG
ncbi:MAG TPA: hypothetical protein VFJ58_14515 [Armatimonadota bacterium]|nr:hypothetical protein [Armatimonadota bacterium]